MLIVLRAISLMLMAQPGPAPAPIDYCQSVTVESTRAALAALKSADRVHAGADARAFAVAYEGTVSLEAHLMRPGMVRAIPIRIELTVDPQAGSMVLKEISGPPAAPQAETTLVHQERVARQPAANRPFTEDAPEAAAGAAADIARWLPTTILRAALRAAPSCRAGPPIDHRGQPLKPITFAHAAGHACTLLLDSANRLVRVEELSAHQRLGDVCNWTQFDGWEERDGMALPLRITRFIVQDSTTTRFDLALAADRPPAASDTFLLPAPHQGDIPSWGRRAPPTDGMEFVPLAPGLWSLEIAASDSRILVIEGPTDLVVLGARDGDEVCGRLVLALADRFPGKPIGKVALGHHHPGPSGGLRAMAAAGATIVCPSDLEPHVRDLLSRATSLGLPAVPGPAEPRLELFDGQTTIDRGELSVRLINIGEHSAHAFSYVVFYFPTLGLLFQDDLGYFPADRAARVNPRLMGLSDRLGALGIEPRRLVQSWPVRNALREVEWSTVAGLVNAEHERRQAR